MTNEGITGQQTSIPMLFGDRLYADLRIVEVKGSAAESRPARVEIETISPKGLRFVTELRFPVGPLLMLAFDISIASHHIRLKGFIVYSRRKKTKNEYEILYLIDEPTKVELRKLLHKLAMMYVPQYMKAEYYYHFFTESSYDFANNRINLLM